jgi:hypothetical protein
MKYAIGNAFCGNDVHIKFHEVWYRLSKVVTGVHM